MKNTFLALFTIIILSSSLWAKTSLWKVHGKTNTVYILGSVHLLKPDAYPLDATIETAFNDSPNLVFEMNMDSAGTPQAQKFILSKAMFTDEKSLKSTISSSTFQLADSLCTLVGLDINRLLVFKPWMVATTVMLVKIQKMGFDPNYGVDHIYFNKGKEAQKELLAFETVQEQIGFIDGLDLSVQEKMIRQMAVEFNTIETYLDEIVASWKGGAMNTLEELFLDSYRQEPELHEILLNQRNRNWMHKIRTYLDGTANYMIIVGAGHLVGEQGLIELLKKENYMVEQL